MIDFDKLLFVGESNPHSPFCVHDLDPHPPGSAGARLAAMLGLSPDEYSKRVRRVNLCGKVWNLDHARRTVERLLLWYDEDHFVLLGFKVSRAFAVDFVPWSVCRKPYKIFAPVLLSIDKMPRVVKDVVDRAPLLLTVPHPSGRCRLWNSPEAKGNLLDCLGRLS